MVKLIPSSQNPVLLANEGSEVGKLRYQGSRAATRVYLWIPALTKANRSLRLRSFYNVGDDSNSRLNFTVLPRRLRLLWVTAFISALCLSLTTACGHKGSLKTPIEVEREEAKEKKNTTTN